MLRPALMLAALLLAAAPAGAQGWPNGTGMRGDALRGTVESFDRFNQYPQARVVGEDRRESITGWLGQAQEWVEERAGYVGQSDRESQRYFNLRRQWDEDFRPRHMRN